MTEQRTDDLIQFASELSFSTTDEAIESSLETIEGLETQLAEMVDEPENRESVGTFADDEYNALLDTYGEPRSGSDGGALNGLQFAVKDCIAARDLRMTCGVTDFSYVPDDDAVVVERLLDEGAALIGKSNMEPFAFGPTGERSEFGPVENPLEDGHISGGSSSGSGAAVGGGLVDFALGTDTGGSVRIPAACCGVVGIKPTHGMVPRYGFVDLVPWTDTIGPLAKDVSTAATVLETMAGHDPRDPSSSHVAVEALSERVNEPDTDVVIGLADALLAASDDEVADAVVGAVEELAAETDATVEHVSLDLSEISEAYPFLVGEFAWAIKQNGILRGQGTGYNQEFRAAFAEYTENHEFNEYITARALPAAYLDEVSDGRSNVALRRRTIEFKKQVVELFDDIDVLASPTLRTLPPERNAIGVYRDALNVTGNTLPFSFSGHPAATVPVETVDGLPVSTQIVTPQFEDGTALQVARHLERRAAI